MTPRPSQAAQVITMTLAAASGAIIGATPAPPHAGQERRRGAGGDISSLIASSLETGRRSAGAQAARAKAADLRVDVVG